MIKGVHAILFSKDADTLRAFMGDVLGWPSVDAGGGWPIFSMPPAELAVHPDEDERHELYLMCDDLEATVGELGAKGIEASEIKDEGWGLLTSLKIGDHEIGLYEPRHPTALDL